MRTRDYAAPRRSTRSGGLSGRAGLVLGLGLGLAVAVAVALTLRPSSDAPLDAPAESSTDTAAAIASVTTPLPERRFTFYEVLSIDAPAEPRKPQGNTTPASTPDAVDAARYVVQAASFRNPTDAERLKAGLALKGLEARVETVTIDAKDTYYRVRVGPVSGRASAERVLDQLADAGLTGQAMRLP